MNRHAPHKNTEMRVNRRTGKNPPAKASKKSFDKFFEELDNDIREQHGPVRILMQGGKRCNRIVTVAGQ